MKIRTKALVLSKIRYSESSLIVSCFTEAAGLKKYILKGVLRPSKKTVRAAHFQLLTQLEIVATNKSNANLHYISEVRVVNPYRTIFADQVKNTTAIFLAEMLSLVIKEEEKNTHLFNFLSRSFLWLDGAHDCTNFHLVFLLELTRYLGFHPGRPTEESTYFDLTEGCFVNRSSVNPEIEGETLTTFKMLLGTEFDEINQIKLNRTKRLKILNIIILYFELHLQGFKHPKSLPVLNQVFR